MSRKLKTNLLEQEIRVRDVLPARDEKNDYHVDAFVSLDVIPDNETRSMVERVTVNPYPITGEYVNSFADSTNYRLDVAQAVSRPAGHNLGDVSAMQELLSLSKEEFDSRIAKFRDMLAEHNKVPSEDLNNG